MRFFLYVLTFLTSLWLTKTLSYLRFAFAYYSVVCCVKFSADGKYLATGSNRSAQIYSTQNGQKVCTLVDEEAVSGKQGDLYIRSVCFSPCGRWLATGAEDKVVRVSFYFSLCSKLRFNF